MPTPHRFAVLVLATVMAYVVAPAAVGRAAIAPPTQHAVANVVHPWEVAMGQV